MPNKTIVLLTFIVLALKASPQDFNYSNVLVKTATFSSGNLVVKKDDGSGSYASPHWSSTYSIQSPVAYVSGAKPTVAATFTIQCATVPSTVLIRGIGSDSITFPAVSVMVASSANDIHNMSYPATLASKAFTAGYVRYYSPFEIKWEISFDNGLNWKSIGSTNNTLYVVRNTPSLEGNDFTYFHTVFDLSCRNAMDVNSDTAIINHVWEEFTDHVVLNHKGDTLYYYKLWNSPNTYLNTLLKYRDAECYSFVRLFLAALKIQGINRSNNYINVTPNLNSVCSRSVNQIMVKNWLFGTPSATVECAAFPYKTTYNNLWNGNYTGYAFITSDVTDQQGSPGVCSSNPPSVFNNHQIAKIDGVYYDPSYGYKYNALSDIKANAFSGWGIYYSANGVNNFLFTDDLSKSDLKETINTY